MAAGVVPCVTTSSSDDEFRLDTATRKVSAPFVSLKVNGVLCNFMVDSGECVNILSLDESNLCNLNFNPCDTKVYAYNSNNPLSASVESKFSVVQCEFLGILKVANVVSVEGNIFQRYLTLFTGPGKVKDVEVKLYVNDSVKPLYQPHRRIPFHQRRKLEACVESLIKDEIIEPSVGPTQWVSSVVLKPKQPDGVRLCVDNEQCLQQQSFSGLLSPGRSIHTNECPILSNRLKWTQPVVQWNLAMQ